MTNGPDTVPRSMVPIRVHLRHLRLKTPLFPPRPVKNSERLCLQFHRVGNVGRRRRAAEPKRAIESVRGLRVAAQDDARVVAAGEGEHVLHQLPANALPSSLAPHIKPAQPTATPRLTVDAANRHEALPGKNAKERLPFLRKPIRSRPPFVLRAPDKAKALPLALGEQLFDRRRRPLMDLDDRVHIEAERLSQTAPTAGAPPAAPAA